MKFKAKYTVELEVVLDADSLEDASRRVSAELSRQSAKHKLLGVKYLGSSWLDEDPTKRPPRSTPPGGSPGTPTVTVEPAPVHAVAA